jgi:hypothetical protein
MNVVTRLLQQQDGRLPECRRGWPATSYALGTPKARWCSVTFLVFARGASADPILVVKAPRLTDAEGCLGREAHALQQVHAARRGGFEGIPRLIAHDIVNGQPLLVRTALAGAPYKPAAIRYQFPGHAEAVRDWLVDFHALTARGHVYADRAFDRLVEEPLARLERACRHDGGREIVWRTRQHAARLREMVAPQVFEHGDFGGRNLFRLESGALGVSDWEFAEPRGLPAVDLFFFLASTAFARRNARTLEARLAAFAEAFFGRDAWTRPFVETYADRLGLPRTSLLPLFLLCWSRYTASLTRREQCAGERFDTAESVTRLQQSHHWQFWRFAVEHAHEFTFEV